MNTFKKLVIPNSVAVQIGSNAEPLKGYLKSLPPCPYRAIYARKIKAHLKHGANFQSE